MELLFIAGMLATGYFVGGHFEKKHIKSINDREQKLQHIPIITGEWKNLIESDDEGTAVSSGVVVASDYFKTFVSGLRNIFGGRMNAYETLLDRGRREALLRMTEKAEAWGAYKVINVRIETSTVSSIHKGNQGMPSVELFAYGTALRKRKV